MYIKIMKGLFALSIFMAVVIHVLNETQVVCDSVVLYGYVLI